MIKVPKYIKGLIFDCDGTLVDSMPLHMEAWKYAVTQAGGPWDYDFIFSKKGMQAKDILALYKKKFNLSFDVQSVAHEKMQYYITHFQEAQPIQAVVDVVLRYKNILPMAVASGGRKKVVEMQLESAGIKNYFKAIVTADDDVLPKPSPEIFLEAARRIHCLPGVCQVFEDGDVGLDAAQKAGMLATDVRVYGAPGTT